MKPVFTAAEMRETEQRYFDTGIKSIYLMERAAQALCAELIKYGPKTCVFACGSGGNGGDGYAAARLYAQRGGRAVVLKVSEPRNADAVLNAERSKPYVFAEITADELDTLPRPDIWCDCIFGTGLTRPVTGAALAVINRMEADRLAGSRIVSCDIPSGLCSDGRGVRGACVNADETVTFQAYKRGHFLDKGLEMCGTIRLCDIGIPDSAYPDDYMRLVEDSDAVRALPEIKRCSHKNDMGHLLIIAGSKGMAGAAVMCVRAALRSGAGLVTVACPASICDIIQISAPSAMCISLPETDGAMNADAAKLIRDAIKGKTAVAAGPGLSRRTAVECIECVLDSGLKAVLDADALNIISENPDLRSKLNANHALTPHPGEAARLTGMSKMSAAEYASLIAEAGCAVLVKGAGSVIQFRDTYVSISGCAGMAKGGSGDCLTGITGALLARGLDPETALWCASQIHGRAGEAAARRYGDTAMLPTDLIESLGAWNENA